MSRGGDIQFRGARGGVYVRLDQDDDFERIKERLTEKLESARKFLRGSGVTIDIGGRRLTTGQLLELEALFSTRYGVRVLQVVDSTRRSVPGEGGRSGRRAVAASRPTEGARAVVRQDDVADGRDTLLVRRTLRSGQRVVFAGNVVVLGDVNPGAEVLAGGDIIVMGALRGVAHAGAGGQVGSVVAAFRLQPTQLRIGPY
ncbi:MAG: septum site-determining protein MinC, partial [Clostridia bacterium]|nr:septum site-determining protein MinC [Clostridia bacterium]